MASSSTSESDSLPVSSAKKGMYGPAVMALATAITKLGLVTLLCHNFSFFCVPARCFSLTSLLTLQVYSALTFKA